MGSVLPWLARPHSSAIAPVFPEGVTTRDQPWQMRSVSQRAWHANFARSLFHLSHGATTNLSRDVGPNHARNLVHNRYAVSIQTWSHWRVLDPPRHLTMTIVSNRGAGLEPRPTGTRFPPPKQGVVDSPEHPLRNDGIR